MESTYHVYFAAETLEGHAIADVRARLGKLFKADEATLDKLFSGKPQLVKRDCDKATAIKYKQAMEQAGAKPLIRAAQSAQAARPASPTPVAEAQTAHVAPTMTAAERIAKLAAGPETIAFGDSSAATQATAEEGQREDGAFAIEPAGSDVLRPEERAPVESRTIDTGAMAVDDPAERLSPPPATPPPAPDTTHLSMGQAGEDIPTLADDAVPLDPDTSGIDLTPAGTDFADCAQPDPDAPELDLSTLNIAEVGSEILQDQYRRRDTAAPPATDHLALDKADTTQDQ